MEIGQNSFRNRWDWSEFLQPQMELWLEVVGIDQSSFMSGWNWSEFL